MVLRASSVGTVIQGLLPFGTDSAARPNWTLCPIWPPDVFAVAATLAFSSSCYAEPGLLLHRNAAEQTEKRKWAASAVRIGKRWRQSTDLSTPTQVQSWWKELWRSRDEPLCAGPEEGKLWKRACMNLLAAADEACSGVGYTPDEEGIASFVWNEFLSNTKPVLENIPNSIAFQVPKEVACVLPKALTPDAGCTVRSLSHNLALLPGIGVVKAEWYIGDFPAARPSISRNISNAVEGLTEGHSMNLLLVPFPYSVHGLDFCVSRISEEGGPERSRPAGYFRVRQNWLRIGSRTITAAQFASFLSSLIRRAARDMGEIHGVVLPEASLTRNLAVRVAKILARRHPKLQFLACGALSSIDGEERNEAVLIRLHEKEIAHRFIQSKHHRWRINDRQLLQYQLGGVLDPTRTWWEDIALHTRQIQFGVNGHGAVIATLICEDLARPDPVLPVITAIGPNLVIALLMDGPQLESRWPARYATVLADDPGSSVLTLTSAGMVERTIPPTGDSRNVIGLWKHRESRATELVLPQKALALVVSLALNEKLQVTLDGREDRKAIEYSLAGLRNVYLDERPEWLDR